MLRRDDLLEVFGALRAGGAEVTHVLIDAPDEVLSARIAQDTDLPDQSQIFRRTKLEAYREARVWLRETADLVVASGDLTVSDVADQIEGLW